MKKMTVFLFRMSVAPKNATVYNIIKPITKMKTNLLDFSQWNKYEIITGITKRLLKIAPKDIKTLSRPVYIFIFPVSSILTNQSEIKLTGCGVNRNTANAIIILFIKTINKERLRPPDNKGRNSTM